MPVVEGATLTLLGHSSRGLQLCGELELRVDSVCLPRGNAEKHFPAIKAPTSFAISLTPLPSDFKTFQFLNLLLDVAAFRSCKRGSSKGSSTGRWRAVGEVLLVFRGLLRPCGGAVSHQRRSPSQLILCVFLVLRSLD